LLREKKRGYKGCWGNTKMKRTMIRSVKVAGKQGGNFISDRKGGNKGWKI